MSQNPFQAPKSDVQAIGVLSGQIEDLRAVAQAQKGVLACILLQLIGYGAQFAAPEPLNFVIAIGTLIVALVGTVFIFMLAIKVYSTAAGVLLGILTLIPCLGLIVLLFVNSKATNILKQNGIKVGLLGANLSQI